VVGTEGDWNEKSGLATCAIIFGPRSECYFTMICFLSLEIDTVLLRVHEGAFRTAGIRHLVYISVDCHSSGESLTV